MSETCTECGAELSEAGACQSIFDEFLALEFTDPAYGQVHFLTVACFMIQHGRYSDEALVWIQSMLRAHLEDGLTDWQIRQLAAKETEAGIRTWEVRRRKDAPPLPKVAWSMTIADVALHVHDAESYCEQVRQWARTTLREMGSGY